MGTLVYKSQSSYGVLKCLVAASLSGLERVEAVVDESSKHQMSFEPLNASRGLTDPLAIAWLLSQTAAASKGSSLGLKAEILQWAYYAQSELNPYLWGYLLDAASKGPQGTVDYSASFLSMILLNFFFLAGKKILSPS